MTRRQSQAILTILCCVSLISVLPSSASASQQHHIRRHHLARHHASILHFYPVIPFHATYQVAPTPAVIEVAATPSSAQSGRLFAYPAHGQSAQQQSQDRYECHTWATRESGFDPVAASSSPPPATVVRTSPGSVGPSNALSGAAGGAALGAIGGAIAGDPGIGAAIGAAVGGTVGLANQAQESTRLRAASTRAAAQNAHDAATSNVQHADYNRAIGACLVARGYQVN